MPEQLLPDPVEQFIAWAATRTAITTIAGDRISINAPGPQPGIRVELVSGTHDQPGVGAPLLQVGCWGRGNAADDGTASLLARTVVAEIDTFVGEFAGGKVAGADASYPFSSPDPITNRPRHIVQVRVLSHALT